MTTGFTTAQNQNILVSPRPSGGQIVTIADATGGMSVRLTDAECQMFAAILQGAE